MGRMGRHQRADDVPPLRPRDGAAVRAVASACPAAAGAENDAREIYGGGTTRRKIVEAALHAGA